jgi:DNA-binding XRE family transcriptional regulator
MAEKDAESWTLSFLMAEKFGTFRTFSDMKNDKVQISALFPT